MRYFYNYRDDTMMGLSRHDSGELVNRKPVIMSFLLQPKRRVNGKRAAATRKALTFLKKLEGLGL